MILGVLLLMTGMFSFWFGFVWDGGPYRAYVDRRKYYEPAVCIVYMGIFATLTLAGFICGLYLVIGGEVIKCGA